MKKFRPFECRSLAVVVGVILLSIHSLASADMRCGTGLISEGDSTYEVQKKCGPPSHREAIPAEPNLNKSQKNHAVTVENWVYGPQNGAYYRLKFLDGKLVSIDFSR